MRIEIRLFLGIDAFSKISGMAFACSAVSSPLLAKQPLDSATVASEGCRVPRGKRLTSPPKALFENPRFAPRIRRFYVSANKVQVQADVRLFQCRGCGRSVCICRPCVTGNYAASGLRGEVVQS
jgi:hypothetical protein